MLRWSGLIAAQLENTGRVGLRFCSEREPQVGEGFPAGNISRAGIRGHGVVGHPGPPTLRRTKTEKNRIPPSRNSLWTTSKTWPDGNQFLSSVLQNTWDG